MFEHFGLKDVISGALKLKYLFFLVMIISIIGGGFIQFRQAKPSSESSQNDGTWAATALFSVDDKNYVSAPGTNAAKR